MKYILCLTLMLIPALSFSQFNMLMDSLVLEARANEKLVVIENKIGERTEFWFNSDNGLSQVNYYQLSNELELGGDEALRYYVDSRTYKNDSIYIHSYKYILTESEKNYSRTLESTDSSVHSLADSQFTEYDDSLVLDNLKGEKHTLKKSGGELSGYSYEFTFNSGRKLRQNWMLIKEESRTCLVDTSHHLNHIDYNILILNYSKEGRPKSIYKYDWLLAAENEPDIMGYILSKKETKNPPQVFEITYCQTGDCLEEHTLELKSIKAYLKFRKKYPGFH